MRYVPNTQVTLGNREFTLKIRYGVLEKFLYTELISLLSAQKTVEFSENIGEEL